MMKKVGSTVLALSLAITCLTSVASASNEQPLEIGPFPGQEISTLNTTYSEFLESANYDALIDQMIADHRLTYKPSNEELETARLIMSVYDSYLEQNEINSFPSSYNMFDENWQKLRYGNVIELALNFNEGVSAVKAMDCILLAQSAKDDAENHFPDYWDSAQHFIWNFEMTNSYNKTIARTVGNNHEWGISMIDPMLNYFESAYDDYIADGYSDKDASDKAMADALAYAPNFKYDTVCIMQASYDFYDSFFNDESKMDFWNNCFGRAYPDKGYNSAVEAFDYSAFTEDELILDGSRSMTDNLTEYHKSSVWEWDWYSY